MLSLRVAWARSLHRWHIQLFTPPFSEPSWLRAAYLSSFLSFSFPKRYFPFSCSLCRTRLIVSFFFFVSTAKTPLPFDSSFDFFSRLRSFPRFFFLLYALPVTLFPFSSSSNWCSRTLSVFLLFLSNAFSLLHSLFAAIYIIPREDLCDWLPFFFSCELKSSLTTFILCSACAPFSPFLSFSPQWSPGETLACFVQLLLLFAFLFCILWTPLLLLQLCVYHFFAGTLKVWPYR